LRGENIGDKEICLGIKGCEKVLLEVVVVISMRESSCFEDMGVIITF